MIEVYLDGAGEVLAQLDSLSARMTEELRAAISRLTIKLQSKVKQDKLSGQVLGVRTGRGRRSIQQDVSIDGSRVVGVVSTNVNYMIGWETGWQFYAGGGKHDLSASKAKFALSSEGGDTFNNGTPRQRPFLVPSLKELSESGVIQSEIDGAVGSAVH